MGVFLNLLLLCLLCIIWVAQGFIPFGTPQLFAHNARAGRSAVKGTSDKDQAWDLTLFSPAKINLFLRIIEKRPDNFHELASLFQTVGFGDTLSFQVLEPGQQDELLCDMPGVPTDGSNLVLKALELFRQKTGATQHFRVLLDKCVPAQAGMGGGSGNAATALFAANELSGCPASPKDLELWSADLGSDITFFLSQGSCYCTGRGEILHPQPNMEPCSDVWLIKPAAGLSTPSVFKAMDYDLLSKEDPLQLLTDIYAKGLAGATFINDLEPPAFTVMPELKDMKEDLQGMGFGTVLMSGSGTTIFCLGTPANGDEAMDRFGIKWNCDVWRTEFINRPADEHLWYRQEAAYRA